MKLNYTAKEIAQMQEKGRQMIAVMAEDEYSVADYAKLAMENICRGEKFEIFRPKATIAGNSRVNDNFFDGSGHMDIYIEFLAFNHYRGAYEVGAYLTDIWQDDQNIKYMAITHYEKESNA